MDNLARINPVSVDVDDDLQDEIRTNHHARMQRILAKVEKEDARHELAVTEKQLTQIEIALETHLIERETEEIKAQTESINVEAEQKKSQMAIFKKMLEKRQSQGK